MGTGDGMVEKLSDKERQDGLGGLNGWVYDEAAGAIDHVFKFKDFSEAFGEEMAKGVEKKWGDLVRTMHSGTKLDFKNLISNFDIDGDLNAAEDRMKQFLLSMRQHGKFTAEEYQNTKKVMLGYIDAMHLEEEQAQAVAEAERELAEMQERHNKLVD